MIDVPSHGQPGVGGQSPRPLWAPPILAGINFLIFSRAAAAAADVDDDALNEAHWAYMDGLAAGMVARGPTLGADRETWTGSIHIVELPDVVAARAFVADEPYQRAGLFDHHLIRRFENRLGRTMWEFPGAPDESRFFVLADAPVQLPRERLIVWGDLFTTDDGRPAGIALALQAPARAEVEALVGDDAEIFDWEFGGRR